MRGAGNSPVHTTMHATPSQLVVGHDALLNISFKADWECIKDRKQKLVNQNNVQENPMRVDFTHQVGQQVMTKDQPNRNTWI